MIDEEDYWVARLDEVRRFKNREIVPRESKYLLWAVCEDMLDMTEESLNYNTVDILAHKESILFWAAMKENMKIFNLLWHFDEVRQYYERL